MILVIRFNPYLSILTVFLGISGCTNLSKVIKMNLYFEMLLAVLGALVGSQISNEEGRTPANHWMTISPSYGPLVSSDMYSYPQTAEYVSAYGFFLPLATEAPLTAIISPAATESAAPTCPPSIANPPATANPPEPEDDDVEAQSSRLQWFADFLFGVMIILLVIFMTFGESTNLLGFLLHHHRQVFVAKGRKNRALRSTIAALQANPVLFALPPPTDDEDLDETAQTASGSTQTEAVTCSSVGTQTGVTDSASVWTQTDAVKHQSVGTQTIPDALPVDRDEVAELRATLAKQRQESDLIIRNLQASLARLGTESGQLRAQLLRTSRPAFASPPAGVVPTYAGLAYDPHHNPNPQANAQLLAQNAALQQRQYQQSPHWPPPPGWQGHRQ